MNIDIKFYVMCSYEDGSEDILERFDKYEDAEKYVYGPLYSGEIWIKKVYLKS